MKNSTLDLVVTRGAGDVRVTILQPQGTLNYATYLELIATSQQIYQAGSQNLLIDLQAVPEVGLSGLFALYSVALLFQGETPLEPEGGSRALQIMADKVRQSPLHHFRLLKPSPKVKKVLTPSGLPIYDDLAAALASFGSKSN